MQLSLFFCPLNNDCGCIEAVMLVSNYLLQYVIELMKNSSLLKTAELTVLSCLQTFTKLTRFEPETCAGNFANVE